jgi:predicted nucleic acid-binding Zn finger protein
MPIEPDPLLLRARRLYHKRGQWIGCRLIDDPTIQYLGIESEREPGKYYLANRTSCTCPWFRTRGLGTHRIGFAGEHSPCKHIIAVRMLFEDEEEDQRPLPRVTVTR